MAVKGIIQVRRVLTAAFRYREGDVGRHWIVKASFGASWGVEGHMFVKMGGNVCGIATSAVHAVIPGMGDAS